MSQYRILKIFNESSVKNVVRLIVATRDPVDQPIGGTTGWEDVVIDPERKLWALTQVKVGKFWPLGQMSAPEKEVFFGDDDDDDREPLFVYDITDADQCRAAVQFVEDAVVAPVLQTFTSADELAVMIRV